MSYLYRLIELGTWISGWLSTLLLLAPLVASANEGDDISAVQLLLREGGFGGIVPAAQPLHHVAALDRAAAQ